MEETRGGGRSAGNRTASKISPIHHHADFKQRHAGGLVWGAARLDGRRRNY
jgi:hypothetical protein